MNANLSYPVIIEDYKNHLREFPDGYQSFESFCCAYRVRVKSVRQWMRRHGLDVGALYYGVLLEKLASDPDFIFPSPVGSRRNATGSPEKRPCSDKASAPELIRGISVTFPDGVIIQIRQATPASLSKFIDSYNKLNDKIHVRPE